MGRAGWSAQGQDVLLRSSQGLSTRSGTAPWIQCVRAPNAEDGAVHAWGGQRRGDAYSGATTGYGFAIPRTCLQLYEMALPWTWLRLYPKPDMVLDALFLFPDSDLPDLELRKKIAEVISGSGGRASSLCAAIRPACAKSQCRMSSRRLPNKRARSWCPMWSPKPSKESVECDSVRC